MGKPDGFWIDITVLIIQCYSLFLMFIYLCDTNVTERFYMIWVRGSPPCGRCREATEGCRLRLRKSPPSIPNSSLLIPNYYISPSAVIYLTYDYTGHHSMVY